MKRPPSIIVQLIHIQGPLKGKIQEFSEPAISIGRHPSCHLRFPADLTNISRKHAEIVREGNQFKLIDSSANGTSVNGKKIKEVYLKNGDVMEFSEGGPKVSFLTQVKEGQAEPEAPLPPASRGKAEGPDIEPPRVIHPSEPERLQPRPLKEEKPLPVEPLREESGEGFVQPAKVSLIIQVGPTIRSFKELPVTIGRHGTCEVVLEHSSLLDQHAQVFFSQNQFWIKDLTGQRLVLINRQPIALQSPLQPDDVIALSPQGPRFRFLGEGRLAEISEPEPEEPAKPSDRKSGRDPSEKKGSGKLLSRFKKILEP